MSASTKKKPLSRGSSSATLATASVVTRQASTSFSRVNSTVKKDDMSSKASVSQEDAIMLKEALSEIGDSPDKLRPVYRKLSLPRRKVENISFLSKFPNIFNLDLQGNHISDVSPIASLTYLVQLNLSHNIITNDMYFKGPKNLQDINLGYNKITSLKGLEAPRFLTRLCIDYNRIDDLTPIATCKYLRELHLDGNSVVSLLPLKDLPLKIIRAKHNDLLSLDGVHDMQYLEELYVDHNNIESLLPLENHGQLCTLSITENSITEMEDMAILSTLPLLRLLWIDGNPVIDNTADTWDPVLTFPLHENAYFTPTFSLYTIYLLPKLTILDGIPITPEQRVAAMNTYNPAMEVSASIQHVNQLKVQCRSYVRIKAEDLLRSKRLCPIVICGPSGAGKRTLTRRLLQEFPHIYGLCVSHTTRKPRPGEEHGVHYYFVTKFEMEKMNAAGKFIEYVTLFGNNYGTSMDSIDMVTEQGKVCILDLEYEGVVALKKSMLKPKYILIKTPTLDVLQVRLAQSHRMGVNDPTLAQWVEKARTEQYQEGEYDITIINDDLERAYKQIKEYCLSVYWSAFEDDE